MWHMHEPIDRLKRLCHGYDRVCVGSSGSYSVVGSASWHYRMAEAFDAVADPDGRVPWIHMLRGLDQAGSIYPFASADSSNVARNHAGNNNGRKPRSPAEMAAEIDAVQCPPRWVRTGKQLELETA